MDKRSVYDQVEKLLNNRSDRPEWVDEILLELRAIKELLRERPPVQQKKKRVDRAYYAFVDELREKLRADIVEGRFPQIDYEGRELGINFKGHIYDKATAGELKAHEAFAVYRFLYEHRDELEKYLTF